MTMLRHTQLWLSSIALAALMEALPALCRSRTGLGRAGEAHAARFQVAATCVPRQRWTPYERDQPLFDERARNLAAEYR